MIFLVRYHVGGGHVHCRLFTAGAGQTFALCGEITLRAEEFQDFRKAFAAEFREDGARVLADYEVSLEG